MGNDFVIEVVSFNAKIGKYECITIDDNEPWRFTEDWLLTYSERDYTPEIRALFDVKEDNNER
jgi:hypothetical protein